MFIEIKFQKRFCCTKQGREAYERLYQSLNAKGGENEVFKLARARER